MAVPEHAIAFLGEVQCLLLRSSADPNSMKEFMTSAESSQIALVRGDHVMQVNGPGLQNYEEFGHSKEYFDTCTAWATSLRELVVRCQMSAPIPAYTNSGNAHQLA